MSNELAEPSAMDKIELAISQLEPVDMPLVHVFTPGIYMRQIFMPAGSVLTSMRHKTEHPFIVIQGEIDVVSEFETVTYRAPYVGVTHPGTKRLLYAKTDTIWITTHANPSNIEDPDELVRELTEKGDNPYFADQDHPRLNPWRSDVSSSSVAVIGINEKEETPCQ